MKKTFFLGAGFSAPFGHPVMDRFLGDADSSDRLNDDDRSLLKKFALDARRANSFLESSPTNLEDILSFAVMGDRLGLTKENDGESSKQLRTIIQKVYTKLPSDLQMYWDRYKPLLKLIPSNKDEDPIKLRKSLSFITTNYDLNAESAFHQLGCEAYLGFKLNRKEDVNGPRTTRWLYCDVGIPLYKLHGSVNWFFSKDGKELIVEDRVVPVHGNLEDRVSVSIPYLCAKDYKPPDAPVIIPPSFLKPDLPEPLKAVWKGAAKELSTTHVLAFVGYSFPPSDTEMMYFLARALMDNTNLQVIYVVDPQAVEIVKRLKTVGSKWGSHFRGLLKPVEGDWREVSLPL